MTESAGNRDGQQGASQRVGRAPRTDPRAEPVRMRPVRNAAVVHVEGAQHRNATFSGFLELAPDPASHLPGPNGRIRCLTTWYGNTPQRGWIAVKVQADRVVRHADYSGDVIADLGRPGR